MSLTSATRAHRPSPSRRHAASSLDRLPVETLEKRILMAVDPWTMRNRIGVGINLGGSLEAPYEGNWSGGVISEADVQRVADKGFDSVRIPVRWYTHTTTTGGNTIETSYLNRVEEVVDWVLERGMVAIINQHHENYLWEPTGSTNPTTAEQDRFVGFWDQIATHFADKSDNLLFELLNEPPKSAVSVATLNSMYDRAMAEIREDNPTRNVVIGGRGHNGVWQMANEVDWNTLDDGHVIATFHRYAPNEFTHQGVNNAPTGKIFNTSYTIDDVTKTTTQWALDYFDGAKTFSDNSGIPVWISEFGVARWASATEAAKYVDVVVNAAQARGFAYSYWCYDDVNFGVWNRRVSNGWDNTVVNELELGYSFGPKYPSNRYQGEDGVFGGTTQASAVEPGSDGGYADFGGNGTSVQWTVSQSGASKLTFRYANGSGANRHCDIYVGNTIVGELNFAHTGSWTTWTTVTLSNININASTIRVQADTSAGGPNLDWMEINAATTSGPFTLQAESGTLGSGWSTATDSGGVTYATTSGSTRYDDPAAAPKISFTLNNVTAGTYNLTARLFATSGSTDSIWARVNGGSWILVTGVSYNSWQTASGGTVSLVNGTNTVEIAQREAGTRVDWLRLAL